MLHSTQPTLGHGNRLKCSTSCPHLEPWSVSHSRSTNQHHFPTSLSSPTRLTSCRSTLPIELGEIAPALGLTVSLVTTVAPLSSHTHPTGRHPPRTPIHPILHPPTFSLSPRPSIAVRHPPVSHPLPAFFRSCFIPPPSIYVALSHCLSVPSVLLSCSLEYDYGAPVVQGREQRTNYSKCLQLFAFAGCRF